MGTAAWVSSVLWHMPRITCGAPCRRWTGERGQGLRRNASAEETLHREGGIEERPMVERVGISVYVRGRGGGGACLGNAEHLSVGAAEHADGLLGAGVEGGEVDLGVPESSLRCKRKLFFGKIALGA